MISLFGRAQPEEVLTSLAATFRGDPILAEGVVGRGVGYDLTGPVVECVDAEGAFTGHIPSQEQIDAVYHAARASGSIVGSETVLVELQRNTRAYHKLLYLDGVDEIRQLDNSRDV